MKRFVCALCVAGALFAAGCASRTAEAVECPAVGVDAEGREYSPSTVVIALAAGTTDAEIAALAEKYDMAVLYDMKNLNMCAMRLARPLAGDDMTAFLAELETNPCVVSAERDYIMHVD